MPCGGRERERDDEVDYGEDANATSKFVPENFSQCFFGIFARLM